MPLPKYLLQVFSHTTYADNLLIERTTGMAKEVIMPTLRAFAGAGFALALLGFIVLAPLGWTVILIAASSEKFVEAPARQACQGDVTLLSVHSPSPCHRGR
jgi:hypothetical protein